MWGYTACDYVVQFYCLLGLLPRRMPPHPLRSWCVGAGAAPHTDVDCREMKDKYVNHSPADVWRAVGEYLLMVAGAVAIFSASALIWATILSKVGP